MQIKDATFLITGGSSGIGKATAEMLIKKGGKVAITGRDRAKLEKVADQIGAFAIHADVAKEEDIELTYELFLNEFGKLDALINNAGIGGWAEVDELTREKIMDVYNINVIGAALMGQKAAVLFKKQQSGNIVNIGSTASLKGFKKGSIYASSKFALRGMTECWQAELRPYNVRVMLVNPSTVTTAFGNEQRTEREEDEKLMRSEEIAHAIVAGLEMDDRAFIPTMSLFATNPF